MRYVSRSGFGWFSAVYGRGLGNSARSLQIAEPGSAWTGESARPHMGCGGGIKALDWSRGLFWLTDDGSLLFAGVVFIAIDLTRHFVVLAIHFGFFRRSEFSAIGSAVTSDLAVYGTFLALQVRGFAGSQLAALNALSDAVLLVFRAFTDFGVGSLQRGLSDDWQENAARAAPRNSCLICLFIEVRLFRLYLCQPVSVSSAAQNVKTQSVQKCCGGGGGNWYIAGKPCGVRL